MKHIDGLTNPKVYHRPITLPKKRLTIRWRFLAIILILGIITSYFAGPRVKSLARQVQVFETLTNGRYLVLFQNDAEIRSSGGFIGSFAVIEAKNNTIKPLYFETNIYKLDDPYAAQVKIDPPKPLLASIGDRGWAMRDANFAADFRQSAPTVSWFFEQEVKHVTGPKRAQIDLALGGNYHVDGVVATTMSAFLDILDAVGPIKIPENNTTVTASNFFPTVQQVVEKDYFKDPVNKTTNEPKTILQNLFPLAMKKVQDLPKTSQYQLAQKLLREKKVIIYSDDATSEANLLAQGWAGALQLADDSEPSQPHDFLAVIRSSHGGNKSSIDINPIYRYTVTTNGDQAKVKLEITFEHTGVGNWPSGVNHEYLRVLAPEGAQLINATRNGDDAIADIDSGKEMNQAAFGFWLHTQPKSSQTMTLEYQVPTNKIQDKKYALVLFRQPGGNDPDVLVTYNGSQLFQARLTTDRVIVK